jgi:glyoxylase-like metal-dependent hydrolase (beta-lactamase superfamily II)
MHRAPTFTFARCASELKHAKAMWIAGGGNSAPRPERTLARVTCEGLAAKMIVAVFAALYIAQGDAAAQSPAIEIAPGVYALLGTGGEISPANGGRTANVSFVVGPTGVIVVDTGISYREGEEIIAAVQRVSHLPIRLAILTHPSQEAIFGAAAFQEQGIQILAHRDAAALIAERCEGCLRNLQSNLGDEAMAGTRVIKPDRLIDRDTTVDLIGRPLRLIAPPWSSAPGAIAVFDRSTSTLIAGNLITIHRVPDMRDAKPKAWRDALRQLQATRCRHLIPGYGPAGNCADIAPFALYFAAVETRVNALLKEGVSLAELRDRCDLPQFSDWDQYETLHPQNANRAYLRLESTQFK